MALHAPQNSGSSAGSITQYPITVGLVLVVLGSLVALALLRQAFGSIKV